MTEEKEGGREVLPPKVVAFQRHLAERQERKEELARRYEAPPQGQPLHRFVYMVVVGVFCVASMALGAAVYFIYKVGAIVAQGHEREMAMIEAMQHISPEEASGGGNGWIVLGMVVAVVLLFVLVRFRA